MKGILFTFSWILIIMAAVYDSYFAWQYQADMDVWELNPLARWVLINYSIEVLVCFKAFGTIFATGMAFYCLRQRNRLALPMTMIIGGSYLLLSMHYAFGFISDVPIQKDPETAWVSRLAP